MNHEAISQRIQALESELAGLKAELTKPKKFEFRYEKESLWVINTHNVENLTKYGVGVNDTLSPNFRYRQTEANSKADFQLQKELMCIGALAEQIDPDYKSKVVWGGNANYHIKYNVSRCYEADFHSSIIVPGVVYMPKDVAEKVCEILNNKQVEL